MDIDSSQDSLGLTMPSGKVKGPAICKWGRKWYISLEVLRLWGHVQTHGIKFCLHVPNLLDGSWPLWSLFMGYSVEPPRQNLKLI
jgi:hypothetical protein